METRIIRGEIRTHTAGGKAMRCSGMAARYNQPALINATVNGKRGGFREILLPGAFRSAVAAKQDTKFLINHDANRLMGSVAAGTLVLRDTDDGLQFMVDLPDSEDGRNAYESIRRGDLRECSFQFATDEGDDEWSMEDRNAWGPEAGKIVGVGNGPTDNATGRSKIAVRKIRNIAKLHDVSAVAYPAYSGTSVAARSENRSEIVIPEKFRVEEVSDEEAADVIRDHRRRQLLNAVL